MMHSWKAMLFGPHSLIGYIKYKNWLWGRIRASYQQLQIHHKDLDEFLKKPVNQYTSQRADHLFGKIIHHWIVIRLSEFDFEFKFHKYRLTAPSDLELALYREYLLLGRMIKESCIARLAKADLIHPKFKLLNTHFV